ncbi:hypothetical protein [Lysobacter gummosus]
MIGARGICFCVRNNNSNSKSPNPLFQRGNCWRWVGERRGVVCQ